MEMWIKLIIILFVISGILAVNSFKKRKKASGSVIIKPVEETRLRIVNKKERSTNIQVKNERSFVKSNSIKAEKVTVIQEATQAKEKNNDDVVANNETQIGVAEKNVNQKKRNKDQIPQNELEWMYQRERAFTLYGRKCRECGSKENIDVHHIIIPRAMGGSDELENLEILCRQCHSNIHGHEIQFKGKSLDECLVVSNKMLILNDALLDKKIVEFDYVGSDGKKSHRVVQPAKCEFKKPGELEFVRAKYSQDKIDEFNKQQPRQYFRGFCYTSRANKMFRVSRMSNIKIKEKSEQ